MEENQLNDELEFLRASASKNPEDFGRFLPVSKLLIKDFEVSLRNYFNFALLFRVVFFTICVFSTSIQQFGEPEAIIIASSLAAFFWLFATLNIHNRSEYVRTVIFGVSTASGRARWSDDYIFLQRDLRSAIVNRYLRRIWLIEPVAWFFCVFAVFSFLGLPSGE